VKIQPQWVVTPGKQTNKQGLITANKFVILIVIYFINVILNKPTYIFIFGWSGLRIGTGGGHL
jgi:hypothetical protein